SLVHRPGGLYHSVRLFFALVQARDLFFEVLEHLAAADFHGRRKLASLHREVAIEHAELADLLPFGQVRIRLLYGLTQTLVDGLRVAQRLTRILGHARQNFSRGGVDGEQSRDERQTITDQDHLADQRLAFE